MTIELPLMAPGILAGAGLVLLSTLKELPATLILAPIGFETLATRIWNAAEDGFYAEVGITSLVLLALSAILTWPLLIRRRLPS
jgi:iron(III) transport system permease protein